jgi:hypothetical protein
MRRFLAVVAVCVLPFSAAAATLTLQIDTPLTPSLTPAQHRTPEGKDGWFDAIAFSGVDPGSVKQAAHGPLLERALAIPSAQNDPKRAFYRTVPSVAQLNFRIPYRTSRMFGPLAPDQVKLSTAPVHSVPMPPTFLALLSAMLLPCVLKGCQSNTATWAYRRVMFRWRYARFT